MKWTPWIAAAAFAALGFVLPQETPKSMAATYGSLADAILALKSTESQFITSVLETHYHHAQEHVKTGDSEGAAAEMALFASEGDNAIGGVRKRLVDGGHHHHADGEAKGIYDAGFVVVTRKAKEAALAASAAMRQAKTDADRKAAWERFTAVAKPLIGM